MNTPTQTPRTNSRAARHALHLFLAIGAVALLPTAQAATATGVMTVTATVAASCVVGASTLAFGSVSSATIAAGNVDAAGNITVNCTTGSAYTVALGAGKGTGATTAIRKMTAGATQTLNYSVYTTAERTTVWGDGVASGAPGTVAGIGSGAVQTIPAYGRIFSGQVVAAATFNDTINVTVTY